MHNTKPTDAGDATHHVDALKVDAGHLQHEQCFRQLGAAGSARQQVVLHRTVATTTATTTAAAAATSHSSSLHIKHRHRLSSPLI
jgi:hypothetical protein